MLFSKKYTYASAYSAFDYISFGIPWIQSIYVLVRNLKYINIILCQYKKKKSKCIEQIVECCHFIYLPR